MGAAIGLYGSARRGEAHRTGGIIQSMSILSSVVMRDQQSTKPHIIDRLHSSRPASSRPARSCDSGCMPRDVPSKLTSGGTSVFRGTIWTLAPISSILARMSGSLSSSGPRKKFSSWPVRVGCRAVASLAGVAAASAGLGLRCALRGRPRAMPTAQRLELRNTEQLEVQLAFRAWTARTCSDLPGRAQAR